MDMQIVESTLSNLRQRQFEAYYAESAEEAKELAKSLVKPGSSVAMGGSETLRETGIAEMLRQEYDMIEPAQGASPEEVK